MGDEGYEYLLWFFQRADFGPADGDVRLVMQREYEREKGKRVPKAYRLEDEEES